MLTKKKSLTHDVRQIKCSIELYSWLSRLPKCESGCPHFIGMTFFGPKTALARSYDQDSIGPNVERNDFN